MHFLPSERVALFIDGANLYSASRNLGFDVDYRNLLEFFRKQAHIIRAYYYSAVLETDEYSPLKPLTDWLADRRRRWRSGWWPARPSARPPRPWA